MPVEGFPAAASPVGTVSWEEEAKRFLEEVVSVGSLELLLPEW